MVTTAYFILGDMVLCIPILRRGARRGQAIWAPATWAPATWMTRATRVTGVTRATRTTTDPPTEAPQYFNGELKHVTWKLNH